MTRFGPTLLLALPVVVALAPYAADSTRTIDITVLRIECSVIDQHLCVTDS
jgi:hypothetical protein